MTAAMRLLLWLLAAANPEDPHRAQAFVRPTGGAMVSVAGDSDGLAVSATPGPLAPRGALAQDHGFAVQRLLQTERKQPLQLTLVQVAVFGKILHLVVTNLE